MKKVAAGASEFGRSAGISDILGRAGGAKIKIVAVPMLTPPFGVVFLKSSGIRNPKDLEGKKLGAPAASSAFRMFPAFAQETGINQSKITVVNMDPAGLVGSLVVKSVDICIFWPTEMPAYVKAAKQRNEEVSYMLYADYGVRDMYGNTFITADNIIAKSPKAVRALSGRPCGGFRTPLKIRTRREGLHEAQRGLGPGRDQGRMARDRKAGL